MSFLYHSKQCFKLIRFNESSNKKLLQIDISYILHRRAGTRFEPRPSKEVCCRCLDYFCFFMGCRSVHSWRQIWSCLKTTTVRQRGRLKPFFETRYFFNLSSIQKFLVVPIRICLDSLKSPLTLNSKCSISTVAE